MRVLSLLTTIFLMVNTTGLAAQQLSDADYISGGYIGLTIGNATGKVVNFVPGDYSGNTFTYGAIAGFHKPLLGSYNIVVGGQLNYSFGNVEKSHLCPEKKVICTASIGNLGGVRMHIGSVQGRTLFYANAGVAFGEMTLNAEYVKKDKRPGTTTEINLLGAVVGVGMDTVYMDKYIVRLDLSHYSFLKKDSHLGSVELKSLDASFTEVRLGIMYRF